MPLTQLQIASCFSGHCPLGKEGINRRQAEPKMNWKQKRGCSTVFPLKAWNKLAPVMWKLERKLTECDLNTAHLLFKSLCTAAIAGGVTKIPSPVFHKFKWCLHLIRERLRQISNSVWSTGELWNFLHDFLELTGNSDFFHVFGSNGTHLFCIILKLFVQKESFWPSSSLQPGDMRDRTMAHVSDTNNNRPECKPFPHERRAPEGISASAALLWLHRTPKRWPSLFVSFFSLLILQSTDEYEFR